MKAYWVFDKDFPEMEMVVAAFTPGQARAHAWRSSDDAGWVTPYIDFTARRAQEYDSLAQKVNKAETLGWRDPHDAHGIFGRTDA